MDDVTKRARELVEAATCGEWTHEPHGSTVALYAGRGPNWHGLRLLNLDDGDANFAANAAFIAASPDLVRGLLAENDRLRTVIYEAARVLFDYDEAEGPEELHAMCGEAYDLLDAATPKDCGVT
jgi:hypothetical protein